jgi:cation diffusion facilitator family transporter
MTPAQRKSAAAWLSVLSNTVLIIGKVIVGLLIGSVAVISEAIHSGVDLLAAVIALVAVKEGSRPADEKHPYGHGKFENLSGTVEALLIFVAAVWIIYEAVKKLIHPEPIEGVGIGVLVMGISAGANWLVSANLFRVGKETDSVALKADAWHLRTDVYTSLGVMFGLGVLWMHDRFLPNVNLHWVDPVAAIAVALLILHAAWELTLEAVRDLLDVQLPPQEQQWISDLLAGMRPRVHGFHRLRTRKSGPQRFMDFHIYVDSRMTVDESHHLAHEIARKIEEHFGQTSVSVHIEPCRCDCTRSCREYCLLDEDQRRTLRDERDETRGSGI